MNSITLSLSRIQPFCTLSPDRLEKVSSFFERRDFPASSLLVKQGAPVLLIGIIEHGCAKIIIDDYSGNEMLCGYLNNGDMFLDIGLFSRSPATSTIKCCVDSSLICIDSVNFISLLESFYSIKKHFYKIVANGIRHRHILYCNDTPHSISNLNLHSPLSNKEDFIKKVKIFIDNNYYRPITLEAIAKETAMSKYHFCRSFKKHFGISFKHYLNKKRIEAAKKLLLKHGATVTDAGFAVGFNDASYFSRVFKEFEGYPPKQLYKKK